MRVSARGAAGQSADLMGHLGSRGMLVAIAASLLFLVLAVAGVFVFILAGDDGETEPVAMVAIATDAELRP